MDLPPGLFYLFVREKSCRLRSEEMMLRCSLKDLIKIKLDEPALGKLPWKDFRNGLSMARLAREGARELVLYRIKADADPKAFLRHEHIGGGSFFFFQGAVAHGEGGF